jgi:molecular chaperone GrpE
MNWFRKKRPQAMTPENTTETPTTETPATEPPGTEAAASAAGDVNAELERLRLEKQQLFERLARAQADFANSRRRLEADQEQALQYANQGLIKALLPLMDNLERAVAVDAAKTDAASILQGVQVVRDQFEAVLKQQRVEMIAPKPGDAFEPAKHEALLQQPSEHPEGSVSMLLGKGYAMLGRTLRPAQVAVSKGA